MIPGVFRRGPVPTALVVIPSAPRVRWAIIVRLAILTNDSLTEFAITHPDHYQSSANKDLPPRRVCPRRVRATDTRTDCKLVPRAFTSARILRT